MTLACATNGEAGKPHPSVGSVDDLGALRVEELRLSCNRLGIGPPVLLGFHDSARGARQRHGDPRALATVDMLEVEASIRRIIDDVRPQVVLTFDPHGGYYHPDHLAVHRAATAAFFSSGSMGGTAPQRLFYGAMLRDVFRDLADMCSSPRSYGPASRHITSVFPGPSTTPCASVNLDVFQGFEPHVSQSYHNRITHLRRVAQYASVLLTRARAGPRKPARLPL